MLTEKKYRNGLLVECTIDGLRFKIKKGSITPDGYETWVAVLYMNKNENREHCVKWVANLIKKRTLKRLK